MIQRRGHQNEVVVFLGQHFEETFDAQLGIHQIRVVDTIDGAAHVLGHGGEALYLGSPGAAFLAVRKVYFHDK